MYRGKQGLSFLSQLGEFAGLLRLQRKQLPRPQSRRSGLITPTSGVNIDFSVYYNLPLQMLSNAKDIPAYCI